MLARVKPVFPAAVAVLGLALMALSSKQGFDLGVWVDETGARVPFTFAPLFAIAAIGLVLFVSGFVVAVTAITDRRTSSPD
jgi:hypothetical protein